MADQSLGSDNYACALSAWNRKLRNKTMSDYFEFAITTDFVHGWQNHYIQEKNHLDGKLKLDQMQYFTMVSFAWGSVLRFSQACLDLRTDIEMYLMVDNALRGMGALKGKHINIMFKW